MIVKFLATKNGGGIGSVNYLLNERQEQGTARILKGSEAQTRAIIRQIQYKQKTCFGVLSFSEKAKDITDEIKQEIIKDFERTLLGDYMKNRVNILWVEHSDKEGRLELNFLIPKIDLVTGKSFNPYFAKIDQFNIDLWKRTINDEYGFTSPNDPIREQNIRIDKKDLPHYNTITELDRTLKELVAQGLIKNRSHMIELLESNGYQITRQNKSGISIVLPNQKRPNRMKGGIYDADFTDIAKLGELGESTSRRIQQYINRDTQAECQYNRARIEENIQRRDKRNKERYKERTISDKLRNDTSKRNDIKRNEAQHIRKIVAWHNISNFNDRNIIWIFSRLQNIQQTNRKLSSSNQHIDTRKPEFSQVADTRKPEIQGKQQPIFDNSTINTQPQKWNKAVSNIQWGAIDDSTRKRIIERNREIAERNSKIARQDRERAEREQRATRELREFAEATNQAILRRLIQEFQARTREYIIITQERIRKLREHTKRNRDYQERTRKSFSELFNSGLSKIKNGIQDIRKRISNLTNTILGSSNKTRNELNEYADRVSKSIQQSTERNGGEFRECLERETKKASANCGYEIERELRKPERQKIINRKRQIQRQRNSFGLRM